MFLRLPGALRRLLRHPMTVPEAEYIAAKRPAQGTWDGNGGLTVERVQSTIDFLTEIGSLKTGQTAADVADLSYLEQVLRAIGRQ